ncbi:PREDICTED: natriuretic peptides B-like [Gekko japonicus]|uniref:Natriuretic peptides B-like n=1 Tax=Gekko japonicus TaxID=146911 RepID=A0ABM1K2U8_GEKJA|nr:PREDICTED: natriuretic peptides B-like [Gekko japonicus]
MTAAAPQAKLGSAHPVTWSPSSQELQSLQDLLERLKEKFPQGERDSLELAAFDDGAGPAEDGADVDLADFEPFPPSLLHPPGPLQQAEVEEQWRKFLASPKRRRQFSGCFGTRLERIGSRTGLGCNFFKARSRRKPRS